jgi:tetratricopeptide (TPR) repeat protein
VDWTDKLSLAAILVLTAITLGMLGNHQIAKRRDNNAGLRIEAGAAYAAQIEADKKIYEEVVSYNEQGLYSEAMSSLKGIMERYPEKPLSYVHLARLDLKQGELADSIHNYRQAVELEPDYVDEKAPLYMGEEIKTLVKEGIEKLKREEAMRPKDRKIKEALKDVYYLQRRLAGGCE